MIKNSLKFQLALVSIVLGGRSGRVAWQFIRDLAGELGKDLPA